MDELGTVYVNPVLSFTTFKFDESDALVYQTVLEDYQMKVKDIRDKSVLELCTCWCCCCSFWTTKVCKRKFLMFDWSSFRTISLNFCEPAGVWWSKRNAQGFAAYPFE